MSLLNRFIDNIRNENLFQEEDYLILAVSGGVDSIVLCELCKQAGFNFQIAHCNFQLRGEESNRDENFVQSVGEKYAVKVFLKKFDTNEYAEENKVSTQVAARELRYKWFEELIEKTVGSKYLLTAHHANDNAETLLMNFFKGTGIRGLQGISSKQNKIIRPFLCAEKEEILNFAKENNLSFVEDSSNNSDKYTRNYFRHQLFPTVQKVFPQAEENLISNIQRFREIEILYHQSIDFHKKKLLEYKGNEIHVPVLKLLKAKPVKTIIYEIIKQYGFTPHQTDEVLHLLKSESGKYISSATHKIIKNRYWLIIAPINNLDANHVLINEDDTEINFEAGKLRIKKMNIGADYKPQTSNLFASLDSDAITFPLLLRKWKQGDYFYPLGMHKKKKVGKFFSDQKMSLTEKEKTWIIESDKKIIWIVEKRIDDRCKITGKTKKIIVISFSES